MQHEILESGASKVSSVREYARQVELSEQDEIRQVALLGSYSTRFELMMNVQRKPVLR